MLFTLRKQKIKSGILIMCLYMFSCLLLAVSESEKNSVYRVVKTSEEMELDGLLNEKTWQIAEARTFEHFYRTTSESDKQKTTFRMAWDDDNLYVHFEFEDDYLIAKERERDGEPFLDDCAEIFIIPASAALDSHIGFEVNIYKAVNDFVYFNNFHENENFVLKAFSPEVSYGINFNGTLNDNSDKDESWSCEMRIPLKILKNILSKDKSLEGKQWAFLAIRQDRNKLESAKRSPFSTLFPIYDATLGAHQPDRFGFMEFVE